MLRQIIAAAAAADNTGKCDYVQIAAQRQNGQHERSNSGAHNVKGDGAGSIYYSRLFLDSSKKQRRSWLWEEVALEVSVCMN